MMINFNTPLGVLVGKLDGAMKTAGTTINTYADLTDGQFAVVNTKNVTLNPGTVLSTADLSRFVVRNGVELMYSDWMKGKTGCVKTSKAYAADVQQVSYLGYNTSSGAMDVANNETYVLNIKLEDEDISTFKYPYVKHGSYLSDSAATQAEITTGLVLNLTKNFAREGMTRLLIERVSSATLSTDVTATTAAVVKGSKAVTLGAAYTGLVANDYLSLSGVLYKVASVSTTAVVLDQAYQGASATIVTASARRVTAVAAAAGDWGIKFTGVARTNFVPGEQRHDVTSFKLELPLGFVSAEVTYTTAAYVGIGTWQDVASKEWVAQGDSGNLPYASGTPTFKSLGVADTSLTYDKIVFKFYEEGATGIISNNPNNYKTLIFYAKTTDDDGTLDTAATALNTILNAY